MDLTNRDVAFLIWGAVLAVLLARSGGRRAVGGIVTAMWGKLGLILVAYALYIAAMVAVAQVFGVWRQALLKETLAWFLVPGMILLFGFTAAYEGQGYYGRTLVKAIGITALIEFYVSLGAFDLWVELILLPTVVALSAMSVVAGMKQETQVAKRFADRLMVIVGLLILTGTAAYVVSEWDRLDKTELMLSLALPIWLTAATLPFVFLFSLLTNYEMNFMRIGLFSKDDPRAKRRGELALLASYGFRNRELHRFVGPGPQELARSQSWGEARRVIAFHRAQARFDEAKRDLASKRLARYAGVEGTDWQGRPLDQREFVQTIEALNSLHVFHSARHENGRYREDLMTLVDGLLSESFPESEIIMTIGPKARSWFAWRRTVAGWVFGIGAAGGPPDEWTWEGPSPPDRPPGPGTDWTHGGFADQEEE